mgnify:CR=1 FL=1|jgi:hypothetical protein|nr:MAG TPA: hypothetical protein [Caudoviricetes sp.]
MLIKIGDKEYIGYCNAMTYIFYNKVFNLNIFDDLDKIKGCLIKFKLQSGNKEDVDNMVDIILRLIYILIYTNNQNEISRFEKWKEEHKHEGINTETINEVIEYLVDSFYSQEVREELDKIKVSKNEDEPIIFQEHTFLNQCLNIGLSIEDMTQLSYVDICKLLIVNMNKAKNLRKPKYKIATTQDWDALAAS